MQITEHDFLKYDQYFITPDFKSNDSEVYFSTIKKILESGIKLIQFRSKNLSLIEYTSISKKIFNICKLYNAFFIINDYKNYESNKYCDGIQLTSENLMSGNFYNLDKKIFLVASCHNKNEINICNDSSINIILISPIYDTKIKSGIGWDNFMILNSFSLKPAYALGGLDYKRDIKIAKKFGAVGIAGTSYLL